MTAFWLGLRPDGLAGLLRHPDWQGFQAQGKPEVWRIIDTPDQRHRATPLLTAPKRARPAPGLAALFDLTRRRWQDGDLLLEAVEWRFPDGRQAAAAWLRAPLAPPSSALRHRLAALHSTARAGAAVVPVAAVDPVEQGYRLLAGEAGKPSKLRLLPEMTAGAAWAAMLGAVIDALHLHLPAVVWDQTPGAVHQARVALRRLRAALPVFGVRAGTLERAEDLRRRAGDIARRLGTVRDLDVFCGETLIRAQRDFVTEGGWGDLGMAANARRAQAARRLPETLGAWDVTEFLLDLQLWQTQAQAGLPSGPAIADSARALLADRWRRVARQGDKLDRIDVPGLHELRIKIKKMRYLVDFTRTLFPADASTNWEQRLGALQDALGTLNDGATARGLIVDLMPNLGKDGAFAAGLLVAWSDGRTLRHRARIGKLWAAVADLPRYWEMEA